MELTPIRPASIDWLALAPILGVFCTGVLAMAIEMFRPKQSNNAIVVASLAGLAVSVWFVLQNWQRSGETFGGLFINDRLGQILQLTLIGVAFITILYSEGYLREKRLPFGEYYPLVLWSTVGGMIMSTSRDLLIIFLGLEVLSIALYVLAGLSSTEKRSQEAALKYFLLGAFASGFFLYGIALVYGATGSTHLSTISELIRLGGDPTNTKLLYAGVALIIIGLGFKAALVPFHMWTPDVYQGAPTTVTGFMAAGSKVAAFAAIIRLLEGAAGLKSVLIPVLMGLAVLTMTVGNLVALNQRDVKRILGYSSIAQAGYVLVALAAYLSLKGGPKEVGYMAALYYLISYSVMTLGAFAVLSLTARKGREGTSLEDFYGMWQSARFPAAMMIIFMASLAGIPPLAGFFGKLFIFKDAVDAGLLWLALALAVNSVISAYYYLRIVLAIMVQKPEFHETRFAKVNAGTWSAVALCAALLVALGIGFGTIAPYLGSAPTQIQARQ